MANVGFLRKFGLEAVRHGALVQALELVLWGGVALACWVTFKICEHVLVDRYLSWASRPDRKKQPANNQDADTPEHTG